VSITASQKRRVREQSGDCCEYCRVSQSGRLARFHIDHIIAIKHGGTDDTENLCLACPDCNTFKGVNVAAIDPTTGHAARLFHPREQDWKDHFNLNSDATITGITPEGRTTVAVLRLNNGQRVKQRQGEMALGDYPC
jgi:5-methylcytosine-specific restriction endonuclease McrA